MSRAVEDYASIDDYAIAMAALAERAALPDEVGAEQSCVDTQFGVEPEPGEPVQREHITELRDAINALPNYRPGARIIMRHVTYGPWQYVTPGLLRAVIDDESSAGADDFPDD